jgi:hypothetical protein
VVQLRRQLDHQRLLVVEDADGGFGQETLSQGQGALRRDRAGSALQGRARGEDHPVPADAVDHGLGALDAGVRQQHVGVVRKAAEGVGRGSAVGR